MFVNRTIRCFSKGPIANLAKPVKLAPNVFVAPNATLIGNVSIGENSSVWYGTVIRGDINEIKIGVDTNIQDLSVVHVSTPFGVQIGDRVTVGHTAIIHACSIGNDCLIGMGATVMDGAVIGNNSIVGANSLVPGGKKFPDNSMLVGSPAKRVRDVTPEELQMVKLSASKYVQVAREHIEYCKKHPLRPNST